jgi:hypothetical protein
MCRHIKNMTDFNKKGSSFACIPMRPRPTRFDYLSADAHKLQMGLYALTGQRPKDAAEEKLRTAALGCLERLSACLLQVERLATEVDKIQEQCPRQTGEMLGVRAPEILFDFEALLFHARSALDLVTFFISQGVYRQQCDRFSKIANVAADFATKDHRAQCLQVVINRVSTPLSGILVDTDRGRCLRSQLIHRSTVGELSQVAFALHYVENGKRLALDTVLSDYALLNTANLVGSHIAFFVLNALSIYIDDGTQVAAPDSALNWSHPFVDYRNYEISDENDGRIFTVSKLLPSGLVLIPVRLSNAICQHTF